MKTRLETRDQRPGSVDIYDFRVILKRFLLKDLDFQAEILRSAQNDAKEPYQKSLVTSHWSLVL